MHKPQEIQASELNIGYKNPLIFFSNLSAFLGQISQHAPQPQQLSMF